MPEKVERHRGLTFLRVTGVVALFAAAALTVRDKLPSMADVPTALGAADPGWLAVAAAAEFVSMGMFARHQRRLLTAFGVRMTRHRSLALPSQHPRLLTAFGVRMPRHRSLALAYSRSAMAISMPAGSAISAAYAFRQSRTDGASRRTAATVMVLSGLLSFAAPFVLYATGALAAFAVA